MKTWLAKFRVSTALDSGQSSQPRAAIISSGNQEVRSFAASLQTLDRRLRFECLSAVEPAGLHVAIMRAVGRVSARERPAIAPWVMRWLPASGIALVTVVGLWWHFSQPVVEVPPPVAPMAVVVELEPTVPQLASAAVLAPLSQELEFLKRDFQVAVRFLASSVP